MTKRPWRVYGRANHADHHVASFASAQAARRRARQWVDDGMYAVLVWKVDQYGYTITRSVERFDYEPPLVAQTVAHLPPRKARGPADGSVSCLESGGDGGI